MSATELIKQVKALPPQERNLFEQMFRAIQDKSGGSKVSRDWPDFAQRLRRIYGDKVTSDSQSLIDEGRGHDGRVL